MNMAPPPPSPVTSSVEVKVPQLLQEIRLLSSQRQEVTGSCDEQSDFFLRSEIYRKFAVLDWILLLEGRRRVNDQLTDKESRALDLCKTLVQTAKEELKATAEDVKASVIAPLNSVGTGSLDSFHLYMELPQLVVRENILSYLTSPMDKLNLIKAIPSEGPMMHWDVGSLSLQMIFPLLMKQRVLDWTSIHNLGMVNGRFRIWMMEYFQDSLYSRKDDPFWMDDDDVKIRDLDRMSQEEKLDNKWNQVLNPVRKVHLDLSDDEREETRQTGVLQPLGHRLWSFHLMQQLGIQPVELLTRVKKFLTKTPNLKKFGLSRRKDAGFLMGIPPRGERVTREEIEGSRREVEETELPELPELKSLCLECSANAAPELVLVGSKILDNYESQLKYLNVGPYSIVGSSKTPRFLALASLKLDDPFTGVDGCLEFLESFLDSPLKSIHLWVHDEEARVHLPDLLRYLSDHFGKSLESLTLELEMIYYGHRAAPPPPSSSTWMLDVHFPKLKYFAMSDFAQPGDFSFILCFPHLEQLHFTYLENYRDAIFGQETIVKLSFRRKKMLISNIWKLFPALRIYSVDEDNHGSAEIGAVRQVTREQCIAFRGNGLEIPGEDQMDTEPDSDADDESSEDEY